MSTTFATPSTVNHSWYVIDASGLSLGRLSSRIAIILRGKNKASFTPHIDCGDNVIVINAGKIAVTGNKLLQNIFYKYTGYIGNLKEKKWKHMRGSELIQNAVRRMLPKESPLARRQYSRLYVYEADTHPHGGQQPTQISICN